MSAKLANGRNSEFGPLERAVMNAIWATAKPVAVRQVMQILNADRSEPLAYTTVMTVMGRLAEKGALARAQAGRGYVYEATATDSAGIAVQNVIRVYGDEAIAHFAEQARSDPQTLRRLRAMLAED